MTEGCEVFWGSHGCRLRRGHAGMCACACCTCTNHPDDDPGCVGAAPYYGPGTSFYGDEDAIAVLKGRLDGLQS